METYKELPLFRLTISDEEDGVNIISLVDMPAVEKNFIKLSEEIKLSLNDDKRELLGVALIPDMPIYRRDERGEYYITFSADAVRKISIDFFRKQNENNADIQHSENLQEGITYFQSMLIDHERGIAPKPFDDMPNGTWIVGCKVDNDDVWEAVKRGEVKGFSIDGYFSEDMEKPKDDTISSLDGLMDWLKG